MTPAEPRRARRLWSVRSQITLLGGAIAVLFALVLAADNWVLRYAVDGFESEDSHATENRARTALAQSLDVDRHRIVETAWSNQLYDWVETRHHPPTDGFLRENIVGWLSAQYGDRYIGIWRSDGTPMFEWNDPHTTSPFGGLPTSAIFTVLDRRHAAAGLLTHGGQIFMIAGAIILPNAGDLSGRDTRGYLLAVRPLNNTLVARLGASLQQRVDLRPVIRAADSTVRLIYANRDSAATSFGVADLFGRHTIQMQVRTSRQSLAESERWMRRTNRLALAVGLLCFSLLASITSRLLLRPFSRIGEELAAMRAEGRFGRLLASPTSREWVLFLDNFNLLADDRELAARDLAAARDEALDSTRAKSDFLTNMSHEIRTPMNAILGLSDLLRRTPLAPEQRRYVDAVHGSGEALLTLVNDILDLSKVEAGKLSIETVPFDLHRAVLETVAIFAPRAAERGVDLHEMLAPGVPRQVLGDPGRIRQILTNLLGNALKFTEKGRVVLRLTAEGPAEDAVVRFEIEDTGIGIPAQTLDRIFEKFAQADASTTRRYGGTGLGLSISRQLVELTGGELTVRSEEGRGSTFTFTLPLPPCAGVPARLPRDLPVAGLRLLYLAADGIPDPAVTATLAGAGLLVTEAPAFLRPEEALLDAAAAGIPYQFVLVEGEQMSPAVQRAIGGCCRTLWPAVAVVALNRRGFRGAATHARSAGAQGLLVHPVTATDFREALAVARQVVQGGLTWPLITKHWLIEARIVDADGPEAAAADFAPLPGRRVLVTDDNELNRLIAGEYLRRLGAEVETAASGQEALARLARGGIDVVFMDCQMPELDGYQSTARIRQLGGSLGRVPIVAMTANAMQGDRERCLAAGMDDYVSKPIREADLARALRQAAGLPVERSVLPPAVDPPPPPPPRDPTPEAIQPAALSGLAASGPGGAELATRLTAQYLRDTPEQVATLRAAVIAGEWERAGQVAGGLRGSSRVMGAAGVEERCRQIEAAALRGLQDDALQAVAPLEREVQRALRSLHAEAAEVALDPARLEEYREVDRESPGLSTSLFQLFLESAPGRITAIEAAIAEGDVAGLRHASHALKGAALQLGAIPLGRLAGEIEEDARRGDFGSARERFPRAIVRWEQARRALTRELEREAAQAPGVR